MGIGARVDELGIDAKAIACALNRPLHDIADAKLAPDLANIAFGAGLVLTHTRVTYHFQIRNLGQIGEDLILHAVSEVSVVAIVTQSRKWQDSDGFNFFARRCWILGGITPEKK